MKLFVLTWFKSYKAIKHVLISRDADTEPRAFLPMRPTHKPTSKTAAWHGLHLTMLLCASLVLSSALKADEWRFWNQSHESNTNTIDHSLWQDNLNKYLLTSNTSGINLYDYNSVSQQDHQQLKQYLLQLSQLDPRRYTKNEQMAYWINLYNALTVDLILNHYPVDSIRELGDSFFAFGPWDDELIQIEGQKLTLNDIEHRILRRIWQDPRIHYAVNCASISCPNLAKLAYTAQNLDQLLNQGARDYVNHQRGVNWRKNQLVLSKIYSWYQEDFGGSEDSLIEHLIKYADSDLGEKLKGHSDDTTDIRYRYDWQLNDVK